MNVILKNLSYLHELLATVFSLEQLKRFVYAVEPVAVNEVSWTVPLEQIAFDLVHWFYRAGALNAAFFHTLVAKCPGSADSIAGVYERLFSPSQRLNWIDTTNAGGAPLASPHPAMSSDFIDALNQCMQHCADTNYAEISTTTVFQIYRHRQPWIVAALPADSLPPIDPRYTGERLDVFKKPPRLSNCVTRSIIGLCEHTRAGQSFVFHDLFFDLARYGAGNSVTALRRCGVDIAELRRLSETLGIGWLGRFGPLERAT